MSSKSSAIILDVLEGAAIDSEVLAAAAELFSNNYGIWGPLAEEKLGPFAKQGRRVRMSANRLRQQCLPGNGRNTCIRALMDGKLVGNVFASCWHFEGKGVCWITQLCVDKSFRRSGIATKLLQRLREGKTDYGFGILSSHPGAVMATLRAFGDGLENIDLTVVRHYGETITACSPVDYVRNAKLRGTIFEPDATVDRSLNIISCADTNFYVDHTEPLETLENLRKEGRAWPLGDLPDGCEYLVIVSEHLRKA